MPDLFFSFGGQNYGRYLTYFSVFLANIELSHPGAKELLERGAFSVARSFIPGNCCETDKTMEETCMNHTKSRGGPGIGVGITGITTNYEACQRWFWTAHEKLKYLHATLDMAGMDVSDDVGSQHRDSRPMEILKSEANVTATENAINSFINPLCKEIPDKLIQLSSGSSVEDAKVQRDVLTAE